MAGDATVYSWCEQAGHVDKRGEMENKFYSDTKLVKLKVHPRSFSRELQHQCVCNGRFFPAQRKI